MYMGIWSTINPMCWWIKGKYSSRVECYEERGVDDYYCNLCLEAKLGGPLERKSQMSLEECIERVNRANIPYYDKLYNICLCKKAHSIVRKCEYKPPAEYRGTAPPILEETKRYWKEALKPAGTIPSDIIGSIANSVGNTIDNLVGGLFGLQVDEAGRRSINLYKVAVVGLATIALMKLLKKHKGKSYRVAKKYKQIKIPYYGIESRTEAKPSGA